MCQFINLLFIIKITIINISIINLSFIKKQFSTICINSNNSNRNIKIFQHIL